MLNVLMDIKPDEIILNGDYSDLYNMSRYGKSPAMRRILLEDELGGIIRRLKEFQKIFPFSKRVYIEGNHEHRFSSQVAEKLPELYDYISLKQVLKLEEMGYEFIPYSTRQRYMIADDLFVRHTPSNSNGGLHPAYQTALKSGKSVIFGHTHRLQRYSIVNLEGKQVTGINCGCLCNMHHEAFSYYDFIHQWQLGFVIIYVFEDGSWHDILVEIKNGKCVVNGTVYSYSDLKHTPPDIEKING